MQVSVKKKSNPELNYIDVEIELPPLIERTPRAEAEEVSKAEVKVEMATKTVAKEEAKEAPAVEAKVEATKVEVPKTETSKVEEVVKSQPVRRPSILNLGELLSSSGAKGVSSGEAQNSDAEQQEASQNNIDPQSQEKLDGSKGVILEYIAEWRPRYVATFEAMTFAQNIITVDVASPSLREDILRNQSELLHKIKDLTAITGAIELVVNIDESTTKSTIPIKLEDRIAHIMALNPLVQELQKALDLEVEG
ncbi:MAG: hypothetical protein SNH13_00230 [Rikenellaceae bacterium]